MTQATQQRKQLIDEIEPLATEVFGSKNKGEEVPWAVSVAWCLIFSSPDFI